jgi:protein-S-isoprenylcysteine O-methyltransferase Ste14
MRFIDGTLYGFIGPFSMLYIIPHFLMRTFSYPGQEGFGIPGVKTAGIVIMWMGLALTLYCVALMFAVGKGTPLVTSAPPKIVARNLYKYTRNPMMWALFILVFGEALLYGQLVLFAWLAAMYRIIHLIVVNYEEPQLERRFGESWHEYCKQVPRWMPRFSF